MRFLPSTFPGATYDGAVHTIPAEWRWEWLSEALRSVCAQGVIVRIPLLWQLEPLIFYACKDAGSFLFINDRTNMPVAYEAILKSSMNTIITTPDDAQEFAAFLEEKDTPALSWILICSPEQRPPTNVSGTILMSIQASPGIPLYESCTQHPDTFHQATYTTTPPKDDRSTGTCTCGKDIYTPYA